MKGFSVDTIVQYLVLYRRKKENANKKQVLRSAQDIEGWGIGVEFVGGAPRGGSSNCKSLLVTRIALWYQY